MNAGQWTGLTIFILPILIALGICIYDLVLLCRGRPTISRKVWNDLAAWAAWKRYQKWRNTNWAFGVAIPPCPPSAPPAEFPLRAIYLPMLTSLSGVGLAIHFYFYN